MALSAPTSLGTTGAVGFGTTASITTGATVTAGGLILATVAMSLGGGSSANVTFAGGSLTWAKDVQKQGVTTPDMYVCIFTAQAPAGLASGTTITASFTASANNWHLSAAFITGQNTTSALDATSAGNGGTANAWTGGGVTTATADALVYGLCHRDALTTSTATGSFTEVHDFQNSSQSTTLTTVYRIVAATGTYTPGGSWVSGAAEWVSTGAAYKAAGGGGGGVTVKQLAALGVG